MARPIRIARGRGPSTRNFIDVQVNPRQIAAIEKRMDRLRGKPMRARVEKAMWIEGDTLAKKVKQAAPRGPTGNLRKSINARKPSRGRLGEAFGGTWIGDILVGPRHIVAPHRHLVLRGHNIVTPGGRSLGRRTTANPFVDRATSRSHRNVRRAVEKAWLERL